MSILLDIITDPNPILRKKSKEIDLEKIKDNTLQQLISDITKTMQEKDGVGLAAPQIGKNIRLIIVNLKNGILAMVNPVITKKSWAKCIDEEGCLSVPNIFKKVERHKKISCSYFDFNGKQKKLKLNNRDARIIQHEVDHLDGILFIDKIIDTKKTNEQ